jgi:hypothetical protein
MKILSKFEKQQIGISFLDDGIGKLFGRLAKIKQSPYAENLDYSVIAQRLTDLWAGLTADLRVAWEEATLTKDEKTELAQSLARANEMFKAHFVQLFDIEEDKI